MKFNSAICLVIIAVALFQSGCDRWQTQPTDSSVAKPTLTPLTNMVFIKAGSFIRSKHLVTLTHDFWLGKYEVTQGEYAALMNKNPSHFPGDTNCPVEKVSCYDAITYCAALTQRERAAGHLS